MLDKQYPVVHSNGINKDRLFQQNNDVTFALNAIRDNHEGGRQEYQSEPGNTISASLPDGYFIVGSIYGQNEEVYIFSTDEIDSEIGIFKNDTYTTLVNTDCLGFNLNHPITGEYRVRNGCERTIYWVDKINPDRWYNIDSPNDFKTAGVFDCNKFKHTPVVLPIKVDLTSVNDFGGNLPLGSYYFQPEILDEDLNSLYLGDVTPQVIVYDESQNLGYFTIDGGLNIDQYDPAIGGVPVTNKSITLQFSDLDTSFKFLRINVYRAISGNQSIDAHTVGKLIPISQSTIDWTYQGYDPSAGDFPIDASEKLIDNIKYESAYVMEQVQNRLVKGNLRQSSIDYSTYQAAVSQITAKWVSTEYQLQKISELGDAKNPKTYWYKRGYQGDEVILPGIRFLHTNGVISPIFPLIGRSKNAFDEEILTVVDNNAVLGATDVWLSDVEHLGLDINGQVERWKVFNTATITTINQPVNAAAYYDGEFAYYESPDETYPDITDCDDNLIWGNDADSNPITTDTKVRMFKFPDRKLLHHINKRISRMWARPFGIQFDNIVYPSPDIIGHQFVMADRTEFDKTVVDSGWANTPRTEFEGGMLLGMDGFGFDPLDSFSRADPLYNYEYLPNNEFSQYLRFTSPKTLFEQSLGSFSYYKVNSAVTFDTGEIADDGDASYSHQNIDNITFYSIYRGMDYIARMVPDRTNHNEIDTTYIQHNSITPESTFFPQITSADFYTDDTISRIGYGVFAPAGMLAQINDIPVIDGETDTRFRVHNFYTYKKTLTAPYSNLLTRTYVSMHYNFIESTDTTDNVIYGGDTLITENSDFRVAGIYLITPSSPGPFKFYVYTPHFTNHFVESTVNTSLRHEGTSIDFKYFNVGYTTGTSTTLDDDGLNYERWIVDRTIPEADQILRSKADVIPEYYAYNRDYTYRPYDKAKVSLPSTFNYCSRCSGYYPNRLIFTPQSFDEESFDMYRVNKVNDYIDLPAHRGEITGISYQNNQLLVHTEDTTFILQPNPQQIATDQNTAYLTTGDFLSIPPQEILQTDVGFGGCQNKQSMCNTPFGHCWADQKRGELLKWDGKIEILSNQGLLQWYKEHLPSELNKEYYRVYGEDFPIKSTLTQNGIGCILYYDPRFKRLLVTKRDYLPLDLRLEFEQGDTNATLFSEVEGWKSKPNINILTVFPTNAQYFEDKSWTLSYSFPDQSWTGWHSYIPWHSFADSNNYYTTNLSSNLWKHLSKTNYQNYFNTKYDFIIEWQNMDLVSTDVSNLYYVGYSQIWDDTNKQFKTVDTTFNKLLMYNFEQSSGLQTLVLQDQHGLNPYQNNSISGTSKYVIRTDQNYKIAGIYDMAIGQPVVTKDWTLKQLYSGYIDQVSNTANINFTKSPYDWGNIWDKFVFIRLFYKPAEDHKKSVILQVLNSQQSIR